MKRLFFITLLFISSFSASMCNRAPGDTTTLSESTTSLTTVSTTSADSTQTTSSGGTSTSGSYTTSGLQTTTMPTDVPTTDNTTNTTDSFTTYTVSTENTGTLTTTTTTEGIETTTTVDTSTGTVTTTTGTWTTTTTAAPTTTTTTTAAPTTTTAVPTTTTTTTAAPTTTTAAPTTTTAAPTTTTAAPTTTTAAPTTTTAAPTTTTAAPTTTTTNAPDSIASILANQPTGTVRVFGVVYYIIATPELPSYYVYDGTGTILVYNDSHAVSVGQGIYIEASYDALAPAPQLINVTVFADATEYTSMPVYAVTTVADIVSHLGNDLSFHGATLRLTGTVGATNSPMGMVYSLSDASSTESVIINPKSFAPSGVNPFVSLVGQIVTVDLVIHAYNPMDAKWHVLTATAPTVAPPFEPGEGGALNPPTPTVPVAGQFPGLILTEVGRYLSMFYEGNPISHPLVEMLFPSAASLGGTGYVLQYFDTGDSTWKALVYDGLSQPFSSGYDNLSLYLDGSPTLRLLMVGGPLDGSVSNSVAVVSSLVNSEFTSWGASWGMSETGIMMPFVGFQIFDVSVHASSWSTGESVDVSQYITISWYRVNPVTYEMTQIDGASGGSYTTVAADAGYYILFRATGDGVHVGGLLQQLFKPQVALMNVAYVTNANAEGFTIHLYHSVVGLNIDSFTVYDQNGIEIAIASITEVHPGSSFAVTFTGTTATTCYGISYSEGSWIVGFPMGMGEFSFYSEFYQVTLTE